MTAYVLPFDGEEATLAVSVGQVCGRRALWRIVPGKGLILQLPKTLRVFTQEEGAEQHCQFGNMALMHQVLFDWLDETL